MSLFSTGTTPAESNEPVSQQAITVAASVQPSVKALTLLSPPNFVRAAHLSFRQPNPHLRLDGWAVVVRHGVARHFEAAALDITNVTTLMNRTLQLAILTIAAVAALAAP